MGRSWRGAERAQRMETDNRMATGKRYEAIRSDTDLQVSAQQMTAQRMACGQTDKRISDRVTGMLRQGLGDPSIAGPGASPRGGRLDLQSGWPGRSIWPPTIRLSVSIRCVVHPLRSLLAFLAPFSGWVALSVLLGFLTVGQQHRTAGYLRVGHCDGRASAVDRGAPGGDRRRALLRDQPRPVPLPRTAGLAPGHVSRARRAARVVLRGDRAAGARAAQPVPERRSARPRDLRRDRAWTTSTCARSHRRSWRC